VDPSTGARPLRRIIQRHVQDAVSEILIRRNEEHIDRIEVTVEGGKLDFHPRVAAAGVEEMVGEGR
jgi:ATP-dependent Clp protease ATP-binding subunit ClpA